MLTAIATATATATATAIATATATATPLLVQLRLLPWLLLLQGTSLVSPLWPALCNLSTGKLSGNNVHVFMRLLIQGSFVKRTFSQGNSYSVCEPY